ncbi:MAG TPA: DUF2071 domain-containing protein [Bacteroidia bacterium]|nr:DUF2071 domain-containing protein [Bacteroidia bacterium]
MTKPFLTAEWRKLAMANYEIDPQLLRKYVPSKTELDFYNDTCYVSLVGFLFHNTKLKGIPVPLHRTFEEVNLRFYVRYKDGNDWKRGVVFVKEIVPKPALTMVANWVYKEKYQTLPMRRRWHSHSEGLEVEYRWGWRMNNRFKVSCQPDACEIAEGSEAEFITEHYWGYTNHKNRNTFEYRVEHPRWLAYDVHNYEIDVDFKKLYGSEFDFLKPAEPKSVFLAEGSEIKVMNKRLL